MEKLISYKAYRLLNIAEVLSTNNRIYSLEDFMRINNSSNVTAMSDIEELLSDWNDVLKIQDYGRTFYGFGTSSSDLMFFKSRILQTQIKIRFLLNIYLNPNNSIIDHALELDYSESHLRKQVADINTFLHDYDSIIQYNKSQKSYRIESQEPIRLAVVMSEIIMVSGLDELIPQEMKVEGKVFFDQ